MINFAWGRSRDRGNNSTTHAIQCLRITLTTACPPPPAACHGRHKHGSRLCSSWFGHGMFSARPGTTYQPPDDRAVFPPDRRMARPACLPKSGHLVRTALCDGEQCAVVLVALQLARKFRTLFCKEATDSTGGPATATNKPLVLRVVHTTNRSLTVSEQTVRETDPIARGLAPLLLHISSGLSRKDLDSPPTTIYIRAV